MKSPIVTVSIHRATGQDRVADRDLVAVEEPLQIRLAKRDLAITIGGSRTWRAKPMETGTKSTDETPTWDLVRLVQTSSQWNSLAQEFRTLQGQVGIDWRLRGGDTVSVGAQYRSYALPITRSVLGFNYDTGERYLSVEGFLPQA